MWKRFEHIRLSWCNILIHLHHFASIASMLLAGDVPGTPDQPCGLLCQGPAIAEYCNGVRIWRNVTHCDSISGDSVSLSMSDIFRAKKLQEILYHVSGWSSGTWAQKRTEGLPGRSGAALAASHWAAHQSHLEMYVLGVNTRKRPCACGYFGCGGGWGVGVKRGTSA